VNFDLNEDQEMLKAVAERFVTDRYDAERRRAYLAEPLGFSPLNWVQLGDLGLIATAFSAASGGMAASDGDLAIIFEALGRGGAVEPLCEAAVLAGGLFEAAAPPALKAEWIDGLVTGMLRLAVAHRETPARRNFERVDTTAASTGTDWQINGAKSMIPAGWGADAYIVSAKRHGPNCDGVGLFLIPAKANGLSITPFRMIDGSLGCALQLRDVEVASSHHLGSGLGGLEAAEARANIARAAEALGIMETMFAATLDYLKTRKQFGKPLGSFQALQHRMVAQFAVLEQSRSLLQVAIVAGAGDLAERLRAIAGMRAFIAEASIALGHEMIQLHGGIGVSDELILGHLHKRLVMLSRYPDDAETALERYAA